MKKFLKILKRISTVLLLFMLILFAGIAIFVNTAPQFGQVPEGSELDRISKSPNYLEGHFQNTIETSLGTFSEMLRTVPDFFRGERMEPTDSLPVQYGTNPQAAKDSLCFVTWFGHSAFLIEMEGKRILLDPMLTETPSPVSFGTSRFPNKKPIPLDELTDIDYVIISHDHYDHLDYQSILLLADRAKHFYTALGVGSHLKKWGIAESHITELDWWESIIVDGIELIACPARHFSGRGITDRNKTQWASWVVSGKYQKLYFSGDGGYGPHFKEIGEQFGPFDLAMMECGQYNKAWKDIHMMPEESVQAGIDVRGEVIMPIHWGAFALAIHEWTEPIERFKKRARELNVSYVHPHIGERFMVGTDFPQVEWWSFLKGVRE